MKKFFISLLAAFLLVPALTFADALGDAKQQGLVGEKQDGYLGVVVSNPSADIKALVEDINKRRKEKYQEIAKNNGTDLVSVEKLAAQKAIEKTPQGQYVQNASGAWEKK